MRKLIPLSILIGLLTLLAVIPVAAGGHAGDPPGLARAIAAQEAHTDALLAVDGVVGTAVGLSPSGKHQVLIFTESAGVTGLPGSVDRVQVRVVVTGKIVLAHHQTLHCGGPPGSILDISCSTEGGNAAPTADDQSVSTDEGVPAGITLSGSDAETCDLTFAITGGPFDGELSGLINQGCTSGTPNTDTFLVTYTPDGGFNGNDSFTFTVTDEGGISNTGTVSITVGTVSISFPRPAKIGTSSGPDELITSSGSLFCTGGTLGARVSDGVNTYALSNAHVYARAASTPYTPVDDAGGSTPDLILQPGRIDLSPGCGTDDERDAALLGTLFASSFGGTVDAAIALVSATDVDTSTPSDGYGTPKTAILTAGLALGQNVQKYGRTSGLTTGTITGINATLTIGGVLFRQMAGYATSGRGWHNPAVAGLLRRDERVHAQSIKLVDCLRRVIASISGYFPGDCTDVRSPPSSTVRVASSSQAIPDRSW